MNRRLTEYAVWFAVGLVLGWIFMGAAMGQPAPDTQPSAVADSLRTAATYVEQSDVEIRRLNGALAEEQVRGETFKKEIDRLSTLAWVTWTPTTPIVAGQTYGVTGGQLVNIVLDKPGVTLKLGASLSPKDTRPGITVAASECVLQGTPGVLTANNPTAPQRPDGRLGLAEFIRIGDNAGLTGHPVRNTRVIDVSAGRVDAFIKCYPDADGVLIDRPVTTDALLADGIYVGGAKNVTINKGAVTAKNENTIRATMDHGAVPQNLRIIDTISTNTGRKSAINPRNVTGCWILNCVLTAADLNSAVGIGNGGGLNPGDVGPSFVRVEGCQIASGSLTVHQGRSIYLLNNVPRWTARSDNSFISVNASTPGNVADVKIIGNSGPSPVAQKAMIGIQGKVENIDGYEERGNGWQPPATQPTTRPVQ